VAQYPFKKFVRVGEVLCKPIAATLSCLFAIELDLATSVALEGASSFSVTVCVLDS
jgi:hypothetical protein